MFSQLAYQLLLRFSPTRWTYYLLFTGIEPFYSKYRIFWILTNPKINELHIFEGFLTTFTPFLMRIREGNVGNTY